MAHEIINPDLPLEKELLAPYAYLLQIKTKQIRMKIALAFNHWLQVPEDMERYIVNTIYMVHTGSLLIDDIQDNSTFRRGIPAAHCVYGVSLTVNTCQHANMLIFTRVMKLGPEAAQLYCDGLLELFRGQGVEIYWRDNHVCPTEEEYKTMLKQKTGHMFVLGLRLMQLFSDNKTDYSNFALLLGMYFQLRDDYCNLMQQEALEEWPADVTEKNDFVFCDDLTEGKFTLPIIHAQKYPEGEEIMNILRQRTQDNELKKHCVSLLEKAGSLQYTRDMLQDLDRTLRAEVVRLGGNPAMEAVLDELMTWKHF
ncbi:terpene synthase [Bicyclus anynana]|uniref:Terpene synthase n=1 Tax=Bicyclus anynana TaxID=110368 RepID=A0ABM3LNQ2_BICAN|nr:terpene synthase [Bicyclus anynana]